MLPMWPTLGGLVMRCDVGWVAGCFRSATFLYLLIASSCRLACNSWNSSGGAESEREKAPHQQAVAGSVRCWLRYRSVGWKSTVDAVHGWVLRIFFAYIWCGLLREGTQSVSPRSNPLASITSASFRVVVDGAPSGSKFVCLNAYRKVGRGKDDGLRLRWTSGQQILFASWTGFPVDSGCEGPGRGSVS